MRHFTTLVDASTLSEQLSRDDLLLLDCRFDLGNTQWGELEYARAHLPGAIYVHLDRDMSGPVTAASGRHPLPQPEHFAARLGELGATSNCQLIAYDQGNAAYAARLWWLARWMGLRNVAVLDGGITAWRAAGLPLETTVRTPQPRSLAVSLAADAWVSSEAVDDLRQRPGNLLIDARGAERFAGRNETLDTVAGHVPGARNRPFLDNLGPDGRFLPAEVLRQRFGTLLGSVAPSSVLSMCGSGVTACHNLLALEHAGFRGARLYAGSWSEWIRDPRRPIGTGAY